MLRQILQTPAHIRSCSIDSREHETGELVVDEFRIMLWYPAFFLGQCDFAIDDEINDGIDCIGFTGIINVGFFPGFLDLVLDDIVLECRGLA